MSSIGLLLATTLYISTSHAYEKQSCLGEDYRWSGNSKTLQASSTSFPAGAWFNGIQDSVNKFNLNPSKFRYSVVSSGGGVSLNNNDSEIWGSTDQGILQGAPAIAYTYKTCYWFFGDVVHVDEVDVVFDYDTPWRWTTSTDKSKLLRYSDTATDLRPLQTTALHEIGHGSRFKHENDEYNVMGTDFEHIHVNGSTARAYLGEDVADGMVDLYGARNENWEDVGVVHWRYSGTSGEYSDHKKGIIRDLAGNPKATFTITTPGTTRETAYRVSKGETVKVEFTYENNGKSTQNGIDVGFYVSTNDFISTFDQRIGGRTLNLGRANVYSPDHHTVTIPTNLATNTTFWLGAIIDENDNINEKVEWNNATYIPIRVVN